MANPAALTAYFCGWVCPFNVFVFWMESPMLEPWQCPSCPSLIVNTDSHSYYFKCLGPNHAIDGVKKPPAASSAEHFLWWDSSIFFHKLVRMGLLFSAGLLFLPGLAPSLSCEMVLSVCVCLCLSGFTLWTHLHTLFSLCERLQWGVAGWIP